MEYKSAKDYVEKAEWFRKEYFIDPETGEVYDYWKPNIHRVCAGLNRYIEAQNKVDPYLNKDVFHIALDEIKAGKKKTHWIWFIFPQLAGLGKSEKSEFYGICHRDEAHDYINNPLLRDRLVEAAEAVYNNEKSVYEIFGHDAIRVRSCMLLFASVSDIPIFRRMIQKYAWK